MRIGREVGNIFAMMFAGHGLYIRYSVGLNELLKTLLSIETTAVALAATIGFLGLHSEVQEEIYQKIIEVVGHDRDPVRHIPPRLLHAVTWS
jgi:hypothetical protein